MKRVLILTYYWPPSGGSGVQRWLKFAKYLPDYGWQPVVYTPENPEYPNLDHSLQNDVPKSAEIIKRPIIEPYSIYKRLVGMKKDDRIHTGFLSDKAKPGTLEQLSRWIRGNFFIPDARRFWIRPSVRYLNAYLKSNPVDLIVSTGPPHSLHLIAKALKKRTGLPWVADFRDPWTNIDFYEELMLTKPADRKHHQLEAAVLRESDKVLVVGREMKREFSALTSAEKIHIIPNGYDAHDIVNDRVPDPDPFFSLAHIGSFSPARNVPVLWSALAQKRKDDTSFAEHFRLKVVGSIDHTVRKGIEDAGLTDALVNIPYLPHEKVIDEQRKSSMLLLVVNQTKNARGIVTGKVFEYLASGRPILAIGPPDGDLAAILEECKAGRVIDYDDKEGMLNALENPVIADPVMVAQFRREALTEELSSSVFQPLTSSGF